VVAAGQEDPRHVQEDDDEQEVRAPPMDAPHQGTEQHLALDRDDRGVGRLGRRPVDEHQEDPGRRLDQEEDERRAAEPEGVRPAQRRRR